MINRDQKLIHPIKFQSLETFLGAQFKSSGDEASPCYRPFWTGNVSDKYLSVRSLLLARNISGSTDSISSSVTNADPLKLRKCLQNITILFPTDSTFCSWSPRHGAFSGCGWNGLQIRRVAANTENKQSRTADKGWLSSLVVRRGVNQCPTVTKQLVTKCYTAPRNWRTVVNTVMDFRVP